MAQTHTVLPRATLPFAGNIARRWARSGLTLGVAGFLAITFFTDWKAVLINVPVLNNKFKKE